MYKSDLPYHHKHHHLIIIYNYHHYLCLKDCKKTWHIIRERLSCLPDPEQFLQTVPVCPAGSSIHLQNINVLKVSYS